jgi:hypothetical protein
MEFVSADRECYSKDTSCRGMRRSSVKEEKKVFIKPFFLPLSFFTPHPSLYFFNSKRPGNWPMKCRCCLSETRECSSHVFCGPLSIQNSLEEAS